MLWLFMLVGFGLLLGVRPVARMRRFDRSGPDVVLIARLLSIAVAAGQPLGSALISASELVPIAERALVEDLLARARSVGLSRALSETDGELESLAHRLATAQITGAPIGTVLEAFVTSAFDARRARALEEARTLGVHLIVPLALLLLPGFVALVVGPYVVEQFFGLVGQELP